LIQGKLVDFSYIYNMRKVIILFSLFTFHFSLTQAQYALYGMADGGGANNDGVIFGYNPF